MGRLVRREAHRVENVSKAGLGEELGFLQRRNGNSGCQGVRCEPRDFDTLGGLHVRPQINAERRRAGGHPRNVLLHL